MKAGWDIFIAALRSIADRPAAALGLLALFVVVDFSLTQVSYQEVGAHFPMSVAIPVASVVIVGLIASTWHRVVLLSGEPPMSTGRALHYAIAWFVLGIVLTIILAPFALAIYGIGFVLQIDVILFPFDYAESSTFLFAVLWIVFGIPFLWLLYRLGLGLPNLALGRGDLSFHKSWQRTAPLGPAIAGLAVIGGFTQVPFLFAYEPFMPSFEEIEAFYETTEDFHANPPGYLLADFVGTLGYGLVVVVGAAILTELYRRTEPAA